MTTLRCSSRPEHRSRLLTQHADDTLLILGLDDGRYYALEEAGAAAWRLCDGQRTVSDIALLLGNDYDASTVNITTDLIALFTQLIDEDLVCQTS